MEFQCQTRYDRAALTAMSKAVRKTVRSKFSRGVHVFSWVVLAASLVAVYLNWGDPVGTVLNGLVAVLLALVIWKEDAINAFWARRSALPGLEVCTISFFPEYYQTDSAAAVSHWNYDRILALAETQRYILCILGKNHAQALDKRAVEGGSPEALARFLERKTGLTIQNVGR